MGGFLSGLLGNRQTAQESRANWWEALEIPRTHAGVSVTMDSALTMAAVYACIRILAEDVAKLPLHVYKKRKDGGKDRATNHYLYSLLHDAPNDEMTSYAWREGQQAWLGSWGNAYSQIISDNSGKVREIYPLKADWMQPQRKNGILYYEYTPDGVGKSENYRADQILHFHGFGFDGVQGYSPIRLARQSIGLGLAAEGFGARFFGNDARPGIVLTHPGTLSEAAYNRLKAESEKFGGLSSAFKPRILEEGLELHEIQVPPEDAQFLQTRKFQVEEIARWYRIPPHKLQDLERSTNNNIEHQSIEYVVDTLMPWLSRWEQVLTAKLLTERERRQGYFIAFLVEGLLRGDIGARFESYAKARQWGWMSADDVRELENLNPLPDDQGKIYMVPLNMIPASAVGEAVQGGERGMVPGGFPLEARGNDMEGEARGNDTLRNEKRAAANERHRLIGAWMNVFKDAAGRVVNAESREIRKAAVKYLGRNNIQGFLDWLNEYYESHAAFTRDQFLPVLMAYAEMVKDAVSAEGYKLEAQANTERFMNVYAQSLGTRHSGRNLYQLNNKVEAAQAGELDVLGAVEGQLDYWLESQPDSMAQEETVKSNNALAVMLYGMAGVLYLRWVAIGDSCPYCSDLNGQTIGIQEYFLTAGQSYQPEGAEQPLTVNKSKRHAPAHDGCDCVVVAG